MIIGTLLCYVVSQTFQHLLQLATDITMLSMLWLWWNIMGSEPERIISRAAKTEKIEKQTLQHAVNSARRATKTIKHS